MAAAFAGCTDKDRDTREVPIPTPSPTPGSRADKNIIEYHHTITPQTPADQCIHCHGDMTAETSLLPSVEAFHNYKHNTLSTWSCLNCHNGPIDLINRNAYDQFLRKTVDIETTCMQCHGPGGPNTVLYQ
ncbi:MAG: hypothetical protein ACYS47_13560 [Planctomycetota bacterium]